MNTKYIVFDNTHAVIFYGDLYHNGIFYRHEDMDMFPVVTSAGFCHVYTSDSGKIDVAVYGESESLKLKSKPEDAMLIKLALGLPLK